MTHFEKKSSTHPESDGGRTFAAHTPEAPAIVAVSGGRDSLLALTRLAEQGLAAAAALGRFLPEDPSYDRRSQALEDICSSLNVPLLELDLRKQFDRHVVRPFVRDYTKGRTPNPCALCNPAIKFGLLYEAAKDALHLQYQPTFATGHYARIVRHPEWGVMLARAEDDRKDQSYFLALLPKELLSVARFPLAETHKAEVSQLLAGKGLTPPDASESQEICFIPDNDYRAFLEVHASRFGFELGGEGPACLPDGTEVGRHLGLWRYTQGQRRGLGIPHSEPLYVLAKDVAANTLLVGPKTARRSQGCVLEELNYFAPLEEWPDRILARTRYRQIPRPVAATPHELGLALRFLEPEAEAADGPPAPGQLGVISDASGLILAGGRIADAPVLPQGGR